MSAALDTPIAPVGNVALPDARPALLIAVDTADGFGSAIMRDVKTTRQLRPGVGHLQTVLLSGAGWCAEPTVAPDWSLNAVEAAWPEWREIGVEQVTRLITRARRQASTRPQTMDITIVAHLNDPVSTALWPRVLDVVRRAHLSFHDYAVTLILALDSLALRTLSVEAKIAWRERIDTLVAVLKDDAASTAPTGRIGWCYLLDTHDIDAYPLQPWAKTVESPPPTTLQAHQIAEFVTLRVAGFGHSGAYRRTDRRHIQRDLGLDDTAWVSSFRAGSETLGVSAARHVFVETQATQLVETFIGGLPQPTDRPRGRQAGEGWLADAELEAADVRRGLVDAAAADVMAARLTPPDLTDVPDAAWVDRLASWDALLWSAWSAEDGPATAIAAAGREHAQRAAEALRTLVAGLVYREPGGWRVGRAALAHIRLRLVAMRDRLDEVRPRRYWLVALFAPDDAAEPAPPAVPDVAPFERVLVRVLQRRVNSRAVWRRAAIEAVVLFLYMGALYRTVGAQWGWHGFVARWPFVADAAGQLLTRLDLIFTLFAVTVLAASAGVVELVWCNWRIASARERLIREIRRKYQDVLPSRAIWQAEQRLYGILDRAVVEQKPVVDAFEAAVQAREAAVENDGGFGTGLLLTERCLVSSADRPLLFPGVTGADAAKWATDFLAEWDPSEPLRVQLVAWLDAKTAEWWRRITLAWWADRWREPQFVTSRIQVLQDALQVALPVGVPERMSVEPTRAGPRGWATPLLMTHALGYPAAVGDSKKKVEVEVATAATASNTFAFDTGDPGRLAYVRLADGIDLETLRLWHELDCGEEYA